MRSFNDWYFDLFESGNGAYLNQQEIAEEAWQHQQSKVDELQYRIDTSLDEIRRALNCVESTETECVLRELEQALKGDKS